MDQFEREQIKKEAEQLLEKFSKQLSTISSKGENNVERENDRRDDENGNTYEAEFKKIMLENAPAKDEDCIIAETKSW